MNVYEEYFRLLARCAVLDLENADLKVKLAHAGEIEDKAIERMIEYKSKYESEQER